MRKKGANKINIICTFALFTEGIDNFIQAYKDNLFDALYTTNLSYIPQDYSAFEWFNVIDLSVLVAKIIDKLDKKESVSEYLGGKSEIVNKISKI